MTANCVQYKSPGKIILSGEHSVAHGKAAIAAAIDVQCYASFECTDRQNGDTKTIVSFQPDCFIEVCFPNAEIAELLPLYLSSSVVEITHLPTNEQIKTLERFVSEYTSEKFLALAAQCFLHCFLSSYVFLNCENYLKCKNYRISVKSDIPLGAGLGSSAAFNTATAACVLDLLGGLKSGKGKELLVDDQRKVNELAFAAEHIVHGKPSGVDTYVSCYGRPILFNKKSFQEDISIPSFQFLIVNTQEERNTRVLVEKVSKLKEASMQMFDDLIEKMDLCTKSIASILKESKTKDSKFWEDLAEQIRVNQDLLEQLGVSTEKLTQVVKVAQNENCAAKLTGAGGGGCAIVILPPNWEVKCPSLKEKLEMMFSDLECDVLPASLALSGVQRIC